MIKSNSNLKIHKIEENGLQGVARAVRQPRLGVPGWVCLVSWNVAIFFGRLCVAVVLNRVGFGCASGAVTAVVFVVVSAYLRSVVVGGRLFSMDVCVVPSGV